MLLEGRVAVVSGVGPGIGRDTALAFAREGADVALGARSPEKLADVAREVEALGRRAVAVPTDIAEAEQCERLAKTAAGELGRVDVLVNNAFLQPPFETIEDGSLDGWRRSFEVNVLGSLQMTRAAIPHMKERGGSIVFVSSMAARRIMSGLGAYAATKASLLTAVQTLAREAGGYGIRVNSVVPGYVLGPSLRWYFKQLAKERGCTPEQVHAEVAAETCLGRIPTSEDVASAILFLASDLAGAITGQALDVNAGHWFH